MSNENGNQPAFPASASYNDMHPDVIQVQQEGLTKREYFAGLAMQGMLKKGGPQSPRQLAESAISFADELLKALENG